MHALYQELNWITGFMNTAKKAGAVYLKTQG